MSRILRLTLAVLLVSVIVPASPASAATIGNITAFSGSGNSYTITAGTAKVRVNFARADIFRLWLATNGSFTDPAGTDLAIRTDFGAVTTTSADAGDHYRISTSALVLRAFKTPLRFELYRADNATLVWRESTGLTWTGTQTTQSLARGADEQFYGTGLRLGNWALRDKSVPIAIDNQWRENTNASPAPFYMSTNGYGVFRNTWTRGQYNFLSPVSLRHDETRFDAYYFVGGSLKSVLGGYTDVTGKPFLAPIWGFELGNADCWNASNPDYQGDRNRARHQITPDVVGYAQDARNANMPSGWFLPNDGYGCSYQQLPQTVASLNNLGFSTGLWTSTGLSNIGYEVGTAGTRGVKTDVAWIGSGYKYAFDGVKQAVAGIENNSDARRFVWTVDGWAGTQRNAVVWTGDTYGNFADMRWHVPAIAGAGLSGLNYAAGDVDGIFSGSPKTYVRDLEWKSFTPAFMTMSGWGATNPSSGYNDKQPWRFAEPYLSANRKYLQLKMRLMPYHYSMSRNANVTGVPATRAMVLEYPGDPVARGDQTSQQFMAGDSFLVAPVTSDTTVRDNIYLPAGTWTDYWTGKVWQGPGWLNGYQAPLETLPLFVKGGGIIPMWPQMNHNREKPKNPITFDIYPRGNSNFTLYEDDGLTRSYQTGAYATQQVDVATGTDVTVTVGASNGSYTGKLTSRGYEVKMHLASAPSSVTLNGATVGSTFSGGVLTVNVPSTSAGFEVKALNAVLPTPTPVGGTPPTGPVQIVHQTSGKCIDIPYGSTTPGTVVTLYSCHTGEHQKWTFNANGTVTGKGGTCLDAFSNFEVGIATCNSATSQKWTFNTDGTMINGGGRCLATANNGTANGTKIVTATSGCHVWRKQTP